MTVTVRTNLATRGTAASTTNWSAWAGTGGTTALTNQSTGGAFGATFNRDTWSVATTAPSGGIIYTEPSGIAASTQYAVQMWVRASKAQTAHLTVDFRNSSNTVVNTVTGANVALPANVWTQITAVGTSGLLVTNAKLTASVSSGSNWAVGDTFDGDAVCFEAGAVVGGYFDGGSTSTTGLPTNQVYAWTGTVNASTSTETTRTVTLTATGTTPAGACPRAQVTVQDAGTASYTVQLTRLCEGVTMVVQGAVTRSLIDSDVITDFACPLNRTVTYNLVWNGQVVATATLTLAATTAWVADPLQPDKAIPVKLDGNNPGYLTMDSDSLREVTYPGGAKTIMVLGSSYPSLLGGQPQMATGNVITLYSDDKATADSFRTMLIGTPMLLLRPLANMDPLPAVAYLTREIKEQDVTRIYGGNTAKWVWTGDIIAAVTQAVLSGLATYDQVQALIGSANTYTQVQTKAAATTYLDWQKNPLIWSTL